MIKLLITLNLLSLRLMTPMGRHLNRAHHTLRSTRRDERGSVTVEQVIWAVALILLAGTVVAAIKAYVDGKIPLIK